MPSHRKLQVHQGLDVQTVKVKNALAEIEQTERRDNPDESQHCGDCQHEAHVPGLGLVFVLNIVIGNRQNGPVVEQGQHHDHYRGEGIEVEDQDRQRHEEQHPQRLRDAVNGVTVHPLEDAATLLDCVNDHRQARRKQHDRRRRAGRVCGAGNGDAAVGFLQCWGVVHTIASHANNVLALLQNIHDVEFVLGEYLGESVRLFDGLRHLRRLLLLRVTQCAGIQDVCAQSELFRGFPCDGNLIARNHLDVHAHLPGARDGRFGLLAGWVEQRQHADELPLALLICPGYAKGPVAASRKLIDSLLDGRLDLADVGCHLQNYLRGTFGHKELLPVRSFDGSFRSFMHRVEGLKVKYLEALQLLVVLHSTDHRKVDGVFVLSARSKRSPENDVVRSNSVHIEGIAQREFVLSQRPGLVRAQDIHSSQLLNGRQAGHNRFLFR